jgi:transposase InsO family protein
MTSTRSTTSSQPGELPPLQLAIPAIGKEERIEDWAVLFRGAVSSYLTTTNGQRIAIGLLPSHLNRSLAEKELVRDVVKECTRLDDALEVLKSLDPPRDKSAAIQKLCRVDWRPGSTVDDFYYELRKWAKESESDILFVCQLFVAQLPRPVQKKAKVIMAEWETAGVSAQQGRELLKAVKEELSTRGISLSVGYKDFDRLAEGVASLTTNDPACFGSDTVDSAGCSGDVNVVYHSARGKARGGGFSARRTGGGQAQASVSAGSGPSRPPPGCFVCGAPGHMMRQCPKGRCHRCGQLGHNVFHCPSPRDNDRSVKAVSGDSIRAAESAASGCASECAAMIHARINGHETLAVVDTGAGPSVMSLTRHKAIGSPHIEVTSSRVFAVGKQEVPVVGRVTVTVELSGESVSHEFSVLDISEDTLIMGRTLLAMFGSTEFDWQEGCVRLGKHRIGTEVLLRGGSFDQRCAVARCESPDSGSSVGVNASFESHFNISPELQPDQHQQILSLLSEFADVFAADPNRPSRTHLATHAIDTAHASPFKQKVGRMSPEKEEEVNQQIDRMLENGIIRASNSPWSSRVLLVKKKDGTVRFVIDFRALNDLTRKDSYPMPQIHDVVDRMAGSTMFSTLDGASAYWAVPLTEDSKQKTAFSVPRGQFELEVMSFGLCNAQATYQRVHDQVLQPVSNTFAYVDDACTFSSSFNQHLRDLREALSAYRSAGMQLKRSKCKFGYSSVEFVGYLLSAGGLAPLPEYTAAVSNFEVPTSVKELQRFLGLVNYYRHFIKDMATIAHPLYELTKKGSSFLWTEQHQSAFSALKRALSSPPVLAFVVWNRPFVIESDASRVAVGAILSQRGEDDLLRPVAYFSSGLTANQRNYSATELECWGLIACTRKWRVYIDAAVEVVLVTDHNPLVWLRDQRDPRGKFARWIMELEELNYRIEYRRGRENEAADCLSRCLVPVDAAVQDDDAFFDSKIGKIFGNNDLTVRLRVEQRNDHDIAGAIDQLQASNSVTSGKYRAWNHLRMDDDILVRGRKIVLPDVMRREVVAAIHAIQHGGVKVTTDAVNEHFCAKGLQAIVSAIVESCEVCQRNKRSYQLKAPLEIFSSEYSRPRMAVAMDVATLPWADEQYRHFLVVVDLFARFVELIPLKDQKAATVAAAFRDGWVLRHGTPLALLSDQGPSMDGDVVRALCDLHGIKKLHSSPHHPEGDGLAERVVQSAKLKLRCILSARDVSNSQWPTLLSEVAFILNSQPNSSTKVAPHEVFYGEILRHPAISTELATACEVGNDRDTAEQSVSAVKAKVDELTQGVSANLAIARRQAKRFYDRKTKPKVILPGGFVMVDNRYRRSGLDPTFTGPYEVIARRGPNVTISGRKGERVVHLNRCKTFRPRDTAFPVSVTVDSSCSDVEDSDSSEMSTGCVPAPRLHQSKAKPLAARRPSIRRQTSTRDANFDYD